MTNPAGDDGHGGGAKATKRTDWFWRWFDRPTPRWALLLALAALGASAALRAWLPAGDHSPKRWKALDASVETPCYANLVNPKASQPNGECVAAQDKALQPQPHDWDRPSVSVYSVAGARQAPAPSAANAASGSSNAAGGADTSAAANGRAPSGPPASPTAAIAGEKDPFRFDRVFVATVAKGAKWDLGDRMIWTRVFVQPINFSFAGYTVAATDNETVKVTSVEATDTRKFSADIGLTIPGLEGPKAGLIRASGATSR